MYSCEESTRLLSEAQERPLGHGERLALRLHLLMCGACRSFEQQLGWLRRVSDHYVPPEPPPASDADGEDPEPSAGP